MVGDKQVTGKKQFKDYKWSYRNRTVKICRQIGDEGNFHLVYNLYHPITLEEWNMRKISKVQKNVRQFLYNYLRENGLKTNYVVKVDVPTNPSKDKVFVELQIYCPASDSVLLEGNKDLSEILINKLVCELDNIG